MTRNIGIYSGTFDPIHVGHITFAKDATRELNLDAVIFLPEPQPRGKRHATDIRHRIELIKQATQNDSILQVLHLSSQQFTITETLPELRSQFADANFTLLVGSDIIQTFTYRWDNLEILLKEVVLAVGMRTGDNEQKLESIFAQLEIQYSMQIQRVYIHTDAAHIASSQFRSSTGDMSQLPHTGMMKYIQENNLYGSL